MFTCLCSYFYMYIFVCENKDDDDDEVYRQDSTQSFTIFNILHNLTALFLLY